MEENGSEGSQQASNVVSFSTERLQQLLDGDKADGSSCSDGQTRSRLNFDIVSTCATVRDEEEQEGDPFSPTGSETIEEPKNLKPREKRVSDVIDCIGDCLPYASDYRIVSTAEKINGTRGPDSSVSLGYGSVDSGTPKSSVSRDSHANPSSRKKLFKMPQVDVTDASPMSQDNVMSCSEPCEADMPVEKYAEEYDMNHNRRGKAVIFNHDEFENKSARPGSAVDVSILEETYKALGFEVKTYNNFKCQEIQNAITSLAEKDDHSDADCLLLTVLTHGESAKFLRACDFAYNIEELWLPFRADKCRSLAGKPKLFIIQACRGEKLDRGVTLKAGTQRRTETDSNQTAYKIPLHAEFLIAYSSVEGYYSYRNPDTGTWFIQCLCRELQEHAATKDFLKILTLTSRRVAIDHESYNDITPLQHQQKQVPSFNSMLIRDLYFRPKI